MSRATGNKPELPFQTVWGQELVVHRLESGLREHRLAPALILHGPEGVGKTYLALLLARTLICPDGEAGACGRCASCRRIEPPDTRHPDLRRLHPAGREIRIQQIRDLVHDIQVRPLEGRHRVFLIEPADRMTIEASNALLKVLEEPPPRGILLLVTPSYHSLLPTVRSRCQAIRLQPVPVATVSEYLVRVRGLPESDARLIAALTEGRIARAATFDLPGFRKRRERLINLIDDIRGRCYGTRVVHNAEQLAHSPDELRRDLDTLLLLFRDVARLVYAPDDAPIANQDLRRELEGLAGRFAHRSHHLVERIEATRRDLQKSVNRYLATQVLLFDLAGSGRGDPAVPTTARPGIS